MKPKLDKLPRYALDVRDGPNYLQPRGWLPGGLYKSLAEARRAAHEQEEPAVVRDVRTGDVVASNRKAKKIGIR